MTRMWMAMSKLEGFPLGALQVFAPIRLGNVPDCSWSHRSLVCPPSVSPSEEGSSRIRGTVRPEAGQHFGGPLVPGGAEPEMLVFGGGWSRAPMRSPSHEPLSKKQESEVRSGIPSPVECGEVPYTSASAEVAAPHNGRTGKRGRIAIGSGHSGAVHIAHYGAGGRTSSSRQLRETGCERRRKSAAGEHAGGNSKPHKTARTRGAIQPVQERNRQGVNGSDDRAAEKVHQGGPVESNAWDLVS